MQEVKLCHNNKISKILKGMQCNESAQSKPKFLKLGVVCFKINCNYLTSVEAK